MSPPFSLMGIVLDKLKLMSFEFNFSVLKLNEDVIFEFLISRIVSCASSKATCMLMSLIPEMSVATRGTLTVSVVCALLIGSEREICLSIKSVVSANGPPKAPMSLRVPSKSSYTAAGFPASIQGDSFDK